MVLHMIRGLLRLLVLSLVPVMVFTMPRVAEASYQVGQVATATIDVAGFTGTPGMDCGISGYFVNDGGNAYVKMGGSCGTGWQVSHASMTLTVDGGSCAFAITYPELDGSGSLVGSMSPTVAGPINVASCIGTELCYSADVDFHGDMEDTLPGDDYQYEGCVPFALGQMPAAEAAQINGTCDYGTAVQPTASPPAIVQAEFNSRWASTGTWRLQNGTLGADGDTWVVYWILKPTLGGKVMNASGGFQVSRHLNSGYQRVNFTSGGGVTREMVLSGYDYPNNITKSTDVVGMGIYRAASNWYDAGEYLLHEHGSGRIGATIPAACSFYWGQKITDVANTTNDEPAGPLGGALPDDTDPTVTPPEPDPPGCEGFSLWDPTSWASAGICAVVQAVMWLGNSLGRAIKGIASAILNGLSALFVPDQGFMEGKADQIKDAWADTPPLVFFDGVQDVGDAFIIDGPSGCAGPDLTFNSPVGHESVTVNPMSACDAGMANLASLVKLALTVLVYVGGFLAGVRIVGAAFGVDASIGGANT